MKHGIDTGEKFISKGTPVTPAQAEIIIVALEEGAEIIREVVDMQQRMTKALRFGLDEVQPGQELTNGQRIGLEIGDLMATIDILIDVGIVAQDDINKGRAAKQPRLEKYLQHPRTHRAEDFK